MPSGVRKWPAHCFIHGRRVNFNSHLWKQTWSASRINTTCDYTVQLFSHKNFAICKYLSTFSFALYTNCVVFLARSLLCADPHSWFLSSLIPSMLGDLPLRLRSLNCASKGYDRAGCHVSSAKTSLSPSICAEKNFSRRNQGLGCK